MRLLSCCLYSLWQSRSASSDHRNGAAPTCKPVPALLPAETALLRVHPVHPNWENEEAPHSPPRIRSIRDLKER